MIELIQGDCLQEQNKIKDGSVDLILTDLPYGNMNTDGGRKLGINGWDFAIEPENVYEIANRILRKNGKIILFSQEPYTTELINKAIGKVDFCYRAIWLKDSFANPLGSNKNMVSYFEDVLIFNQRFDETLTNPIRKMLKHIQDEKGIYFNDREIVDLYFNSGIAGSIASAKTIAKHKLDWNYKQIEPINRKHYNLLSTVYDFHISFEDIELMNKRHANPTFNLWEGKKYKSNILKYKKDYDGHHPAQKPIFLLEDLIKTFSNENDLIVDLTMGSGSTMVACQNTNRKGIGIELDEHYFAIAKKRVEEKRKKMSSLHWKDLVDSHWYLNKCVDLP